MNAPARSAGMVIVSVDDLRELLREVRDERELVASEKTLTVSGAELAKKLGVSRSTVHKMRVDGQIDGIKIGDHYRYEPAAVMAKLREGASK